MDVAWSPVGIDQRFYDYLKLSYVSDFLFIMSYDEQSQIYGECVAGANSGFYKTESGVLMKRRKKIVLLLTKLMNNGTKNCVDNFFLSFKVFTNTTKWEPI